ncbi:ArnT family glycosyltransferase [Pontibacter burrus]|uniref:Glycosyltransferase family 39 protein n=1 Tax=Pontibacter burrus TaxID=2704466 RepID=A0A6B3LZV8_9BACT|nr:glycosyltransferase family 39 protein [Pontibacter burrus]NEM99054.1 glycosyltransferase family 39 protein [Pontibacter burrus]
MQLQNWLHGRSTAWIILVLLLAALLYNLGGWGVIESSEARYAEISREMLESDNWIHPRLLGILHYHKPPVTYIISATGMALFGVNEFGVRFFLQLSFILQALLVYQLGWLIFKNRAIALTALIVYITMPAVLVSARNLTTDSYLATFELLAIWAWVKYKLGRKVGWLYAFYLALAFTFLTKGPVGLIFPLMVVAGYKSDTAVKSKSSKAHHFAGFVVFLLLSASWYLYLMFKNRQFVDYFLLNHVVNRYANPETFNRSKPWWFYFLLAPALSFPWSLILLLYFKKLKSLVAGQKRLFILWLVIPLLFFSLSSSKLILYILPLFAGLALPVAWLLHHLSEPQKVKAATISVGYYVLIVICLLIASYLLQIISVPTIANIYLACILVCFFFLWKKVGGMLHKLLAVAFIFTLFIIPFSTYVFENNPDEFNSTKHLAEVLKSEGLIDHELIVYDKLLPSLAFELKRNFITLHDHSRSVKRETQFEQDMLWRQTYLELSNAADSTALTKLLSQKTILITKGEMPDNKRWMIKDFTKTMKVGKWYLYY